MHDGVKQARRELARGDEDAALAFLWNAVEPARLAGDRRALRAIEAMGAEIARAGDGARRRDGERLVEAVRRVAEAPGVAVVGADVSHGGGTAAPPRTELEQADAASSGAQRVASLVWLLVVIAVVVVNVLGQGR